MPPTSLFVICDCLSLQVVALLCLGLYPNVCVHREKRKVLTTEGKAALIHKSSVNCSNREQTFPSPFFVFGEKVSSQFPRNVYEWRRAKARSVIFQISVWWKFEPLSTRLVLNVVFLRNVALLASTSHRARVNKITLFVSFTFHAYHRGHNYLSKLSSATYFKNEWLGLWLAGERFGRGPVLSGEPYMTVLSCAWPPNWPWCWTCYTNPYLPHLPLRVSEGWFSRTFSFVFLFSCCRFALELCRVNRWPWWILYSC